MIINGFVDSKDLAQNENGETPPPEYANGDTLGLKSRISDACIPSTNGRSLAVSYTHLTLPTKA